MTILFSILFVVFIIYLNISGDQNKKVFCQGQHKWVYKKQPDNPEIEYLVCDVCNKYPGMDADE